MDAWTFVKILRNYKKCPNCGIDYNTNKILHSLKNELITIKCECGWTKTVNKNNKEIIEGEI